MSAREHCNGKNKAPVLFYATSLLSWILSGMATNSNQVIANMILCMVWPMEMLWKSICRDSREDTYKTKKYSNDCISTSVKRDLSLPTCMMQDMKGVRRVGNLSTAFYKELKIVRIWASERFTCRKCIPFDCLSSLFYGMKD